jgi:uncharacterized protein (DUF3820 family)
MEEDDMSWRTKLLKTFWPGMLRGVSGGDWARLLWDNGFRVPPAYWARAAVTTLSSLTNTPLKWLERLVHGRRLASVDVPPPLFVLGHWRSGTTHLQNLLAVDHRFACPTFIQTSQPHSFLLTEPVLRWAARLFMPAGTRGVDNVVWHAQVPAELEPALCRMTGLSPILSQVFPQRAEHYDRYLTFQDVPAEEVQRWKAALLHLARKLTYRHGGRPLLFKSPPNTARIKLLLEVFPEARFVHIHRDPHAVYQSTRRLRLMLSELFAFQRPEPGKLHGRIVSQYAEMYEAYFAQRELIPAGRLSEVAYEDLERDPLGELARLYAELQLPDFAVARPALEGYVRSLAGYQKNAHPALPADVRADLARHWLRSFHEWGYPLDTTAATADRPAALAPCSR